MMHRKYIFKDALANNGESIGHGPLMIEVSAGHFMRSSNEGLDTKKQYPKHKVTLASAFALSVAPVTRLQWLHFYQQAGKVQGLPLHESDVTKLEDHPVVNVSWLDAQAYVAWLCASTGQVYSLPSEAQWEYAARAGTTTRFWTGNTITTAQANFDGNHDCYINIQRHCTTPVNAFAPNPWGLLDMLGNTWEWCQDVWHDTHLTAYPDGRARSTGADETQRTIRGGCFRTFGGQLDSRFGMSVDASNDCLGFRVARQHPAKKLRHFADLPVDNSKAEPFWPADVF